MSETLQALQSGNVVSCPLGQVSDQTRVSLQIEIAFRSIEKHTHIKIKSFGTNRARLGEAAEPTGEKLTLERSRVRSPLIGAGTAMPERLHSEQFIWVGWHNAAQDKPRRSLAEKRLDGGTKSRESKAFNVMRSSPLRTA
jgi:hypothetical protein